MQEETWDETYVEPIQPHRPTLEDGKRYTTKITTVLVLKDQPTWNNETKSFDATILHDDLVFTTGLDVTPPLTFKVKKSNHENSNLYKIAKEFGFLPDDISKEGILGSKLVGRACRFKVKHSKPSAKDGSIFDNVDISSIEAINIVDELADLE